MTLILKSDKFIYQMVVIGAKLIDYYSLVQ